VTPRSGWIARHRPGAELTLHRAILTAPSNVRTAATCGTVAGVRTAGVRSRRRRNRMRPNRGEQSPVPAAPVRCWPGQLPPPCALRRAFGRAERAATGWPDAAWRSGVQPLIAVIGVPPIGKTALAVCWSHRSRTQFPRRQLYLNCTASDPTGEPMFARPRRSLPYLTRWAWPRSTSGAGPRRPVPQPARARGCWYC